MSHFSRERESSRPIANHHGVRGGRRNQRQLTSRRHPPRGTVSWVSRWSMIRRYSLRCRRSASIRGSYNGTASGDSELKTAGLPPWPFGSRRPLAAIRICPLAAATKMAMVVITESERVACRGDQVSPPPWRCFSSSGSTSRPSPTPPSGWPVSPARRGRGDPRTRLDCQVKIMSHFVAGRRRAYLVF